MPTPVSALCLGATLALVVLVGTRTRLTRTTGGRVLAFIALFVLPIAAGLAGFSRHMERAQSTSFCLSCHVMEGYGKSLRIDDRSYVPAHHFQNKLIPREQACFTCHTTYTMFGDYSAKLRGLRHLYVQYLGTVPKPEEIKLYDRYSNRECLHCHLGSRQFEEGAAHAKVPGLMDRVKADQQSCISSGCHEFIHDVGSLKDQQFWKGAQ